MKGFYDKIIPEYLNRFGKKWGAKVEEATIDERSIFRRKWTNSKIRKNLFPFTPSPSPRT